MTNRSEWSRSARARSKKIVQVDLGEDGMPEKEVSVPCTMRADKWTGFFTSRRSSAHPWFMMKLLLVRLDTADPKSAVSGSRQIESAHALVVSTVARKIGRNMITNASGRIGLVPGMGRGGR